MAVQSSDYLKILNERLSGIDADIEVRGDSQHNIFIIGVPRSGTTILNQLFSGCSTAGYINNLMASIWSAPVMGALFSQRWTQERNFTGKSYYGQTEHFWEPHEYGAFWREQLHYSDMSQKLDSGEVDWRGLAKILEKVSAVFSQPVVYKVFQLVWHIREFHQLSPDTKWIWIERDVIDNAVSLIKFRKSRNCNVNSWVSAKPLGIDPYIGRGAHLETVAQVELINQWISEELGKLSEDCWRHITLKELANDTDGTFRGLCEWAGVEILEDQLSAAKKMVQMDRGASPSEDRELVEKAFKEFKIRGI